MPAGYVDTELAWAAGFFDGEGTICSSNDERQRRITVAVAQEGDHAPPTPNRKQQYSWRVSAFEDVQICIGLLSRYLGPYKLF